MGLFAPKPVPVAPPAAPQPAVPIVDIRINPVDGSRIVTVVIPKKKEYSEEDLVAIEAKNGKRPLAVCDITGDLIFNAKNINKVASEREETNGLVISTKFMRMLMGLQEEAPTTEV